MLALLPMLAAAEPPAAMSLPVAAGDEVDVVPAAERGVVLYVRRSGAKRTYEVLGYDAAFRPTWSDSVDVGRRFAQADYDSDEQRAWVLLQRGFRGAVLRTDLTTGQTRQIGFRLGTRPTTPGSLRADGEGGAWVAVSGSRRGRLTWLSPSGEVHPVDVGAGIQVLDLVAGEGAVQAAVRPNRVRADTPLTLLTLDDGAIVGRREVRGTGEERLLTGQALIEADQTLVVGTYKPAGLVAGGAQGMYVATYDAAGERQTGFAVHPFHTFDGFFEWLPDRREARRERRAEARQARGNPHAARLNLLVTDAVAIDGGTALAAEAFQPVYTTQVTTTTTTNAQGSTSTTTRTRQVFVGYRFTHALVAAFDVAGQRLWDHSVPLDRRVTSVLHPHVRLLADGGDVALVYPFRRKLHHAEIRGGGLAGGDVITTADVGPQDTLKNLEGDAAWWFGDSWLVWGTDRVHEPGEGRGRTFWFDRLDGIGGPAPSDRHP